MTEHGAIILDGVQRGTTQRCPHCGGHFLVAHGDPKVAKRLLSSIAHSKVKCERCGRLTCGRSGCNPAVVGCVPLEARLDHVEGHPTTYDDVIVDLTHQGIPLL